MLSQVSIIYPQRKHRCVCVFVFLQQTFAKAKKIAHRKQRTKEIMLFSAVCLLPHAHDVYTCSLNTIDHTHLNSVEIETLHYFMSIHWFDFLFSLSLSHLIFSLFSFRVCMCVYCCCRLHTHSHAHIFDNEKALKN